ncbi:hypothetical protein ACU4GR_05930 [Methylobacterium oryzae CBMB20]
MAARAVEAGQIVRVLSPWATRSSRLRAVTLAGRELPARVQVFREHVRTVLASRGCPRDVAELDSEYR